MPNQDMTPAPQRGQRLHDTIRFLGSPHAIVTGFATDIALNVADYAGNVSTDLVSRPIDSAVAGLLGGTVIGYSAARRTVDRQGQMPHLIPAPHETNRSFRRGVIATLAFTTIFTGFTAASNAAVHEIADHVPIVRTATNTLDSMSPSGSGMPAGDVAGLAAELAWAGTFASISYAASRERRLTQLIVNPRPQRGPSPG